MSIKELSNANNTYTNKPQLMSPTPKAFHNLLPEVIAKIFNLLNFKDLLTARKVCHRWRILVSDPKTVYLRYLKEMNAIKDLSSVRPKFSPWELMPIHWGLHTRENVLKFSSLNQNVIAFHPTFCHQSSKFFSFTDDLPQFSDRCIFLGRYKDTYFLTPQSQTKLRLELPTDLEHLVSHRLIIVNMNDRTKNRQFSLLPKLSPNKFQ